ncbi:MAG: Gfo/Idh/MocA family oxidoreductase [Ardenticatenaceae bacterium]|nr:Gfo/Idh/MocA family oxidoreductase [Ardenticatenaceae bacterium]
MVEVKQAIKTVRWGIIGCGDVTEVKSGPALQKADQSALVAVMRRNGKLAEDFARRHSVPRWYDDAAALIHDPQVDAVYIATPPASHKEYTVMSAAAGKPVYVEKPMAHTVAECQAMLVACQQAGVPLYVAYYRRALARFLKIKELVAAQAIGEVRSVTVTLYQPPPAEPTLNWRVEPEVAGGGYFVDLAAHMLDFLDFVLGPISQVQGFAANHGRFYAAEDIVTGAFVFASGVQGMGTWCFTAYERRDQTEIVGSRGKITYSTFDDRPIVLTTAVGTQTFAYNYPPHIQQPLIQQVVHALTGVGECASTGETAVRTTWVMEQMLQDYYHR